MRNPDGDTGINIDGEEYSPGIEPGHRTKGLSENGGITTRNPRVSTGNPKNPRENRKVFREPVKSPSISVISPVCAQQGFPENCNLPDFQQDPLPEILACKLPYSIRPDFVPPAEIEEFTSLRRRKEVINLMGITRRSLPILILLLLTIPGSALSADLRFQSSTQYLWYTDPFRDDDLSDLVQYVKIGATKIDPEGRWSASGYGRVSYQFGGVDDRALGDDDGAIGRLYFLFVNYALPEERGEIRLGRQYVAVGAGAGTIDGIQAQVRNLGPVTFSAFAGYDVRFAQTTDRSGSGNYLLGASAGGSFLKGNHLELSYLSKYDEDDQIREMAGLHVDQSLYGKAKGYLDWRLDLLHESTGEFLVGAKYFALPGLVTLTGEYFYSYPTFDADTIYTAFAVTSYWEALGRADWILSEEYTLFASYTRGDYDGPTADAASLGLRARPRKLAGLGINASLDYRSGYPGDLTGFRVSADYAYRKALLAAGLTYDVFQRDSMTDDFSAKKYWLACSCDFRRNMTAKIRVEDTVTRRFDNEFQGRASVEIRF